MGLLSPAERVQTPAAPPNSVKRSPAGPPGRQAERSEVEGLGDDRSQLTEGLAAVADGVLVGR